MALIRFYFHVEPKNIAEFVKAWNQLTFALSFEGKIKEIEIVRK